MCLSKVLENNQLLQNYPKFVLFNKFGFVKGKLGNRPICTSRHVTTHMQLQQLLVYKEQWLLCLRKSHFEIHIITNIHWQVHWMQNKYMNIDLPMPCLYFYYLRYTGARPEITVFSPWFLAFHPSDQYRSHKCVFRLHEWESPLEWFVLSSGLIYHRLQLWQSSGYSVKI